jgi:Tfp pilus assembly protein PilV
MRTAEKTTLSTQPDPELGFSLVEVIIALLILMIAVLGVFGVFAFATRLNTGNSGRSQALSVLQREVELLRSAKFTPTTVSTVTTATPTCATADNGLRDISGGAKAGQLRCGADGTQYMVETTIDDDPYTANIQTNAATTLKEIELIVTPLGTNGRWESAYRTRVVFRRVRAN